jgi:hypothetical protein
MLKQIIFFGSVLLFAAGSGCKKQVQEEQSGPLSYGDSVFYVKAQVYQVAPTTERSGTYSAFPDNLLIDAATGKITVAVTGLGGESQTGLRYKIMFRPAGSNTIDSTFIVIAGINYLDRIYNLSQNDTIITPVYNAALTNNIPSGTYGIQSDNEISIDPLNGQINISESIRKGLFNLPVENGEWEEVTITYKSNDNSNQATNRIDVALYYYKTVQDIPSNVSEVMRAHQTQVLGVAQPAIPITTRPIDNDLPDNISIFKPRPPCVIIVGN